MQIYLIERKVSLDFKIRVGVAVAVAVAVRRQIFGFPIVAIQQWTERPPRFGWGRLKVMHFDKHRASTMAGSLRSERIFNINDKLAGVQMNSKQAAGYSPRWSHPPTPHPPIYLFNLQHYSVPRILELSTGRASFTSSACLWGPQKDKRGHGRVPVGRLHHLGATLHN